MNCARVIMEVKYFNRHPQLGADASEAELPRARFWDLEKLAAGTAARSVPYLTFLGASRCVLAGGGSH